MLLPAASVTLDRRAIWVGLAGHFDPFGSTGAVHSQLSLARRIRTGLVRVTSCHTLMTTIWLNLQAALATTILH